MFDIDVYLLFNLQVLSKVFFFLFYEALSSTEESVFDLVVWTKIKIWVPCSIKRKARKRESVFMAKPKCRTLPLPQARLHGEHVHPFRQNSRADIVEVFKAAASITLPGRVKAATAHAARRQPCFTEWSCARPTTDSRVEESHSHKCRWRETRRAVKNRKENC